VKYINRILHKPQVKYQKFPQKRLPL